jgi:hypothetical protein
MPFGFNNQEFSDNEIANAIKAKKQQRRQWCEQRVREYLAAKERRKYYYCTYFVPEAEMHQYIKLPQDIVDRIQEELRKEAEENGPVEEKYAAMVRGDVIGEMGIDVQDLTDECYEANLLDVDFDDFVYCYHFRVKRFDFDGNEIADKWQIASLTDEQYVMALTELLYAPERLSFDGLCRALPEVGAKIMKDVTSATEASAVFMKEFDDDVDAILEPLGGRDKIPYAGLFGNPFVDIAEHVAALESKD